MSDSLLGRGWVVFALLVIIIVGIGGSKVVKSSGQDGYFVVMKDGVPTVETGTKLMLPGVELKQTKDTVQDTVDVQFLGTVDEMKLRSSMRQVVYTVEYETTDPAATLEKCPDIRRAVKISVGTGLLLAALRLDEQTEHEILARSAMQTANKRLAQAALKVNKITIIKVG